MPQYMFRCPDPDCWVTATAPSPRAVLYCTAGLHDEVPPVMRRVYTAPGLSSNAVPSRYSGGAR